MDRMRALEVFVAVAEQRSLAGAARALLISPPSVTRIVSDLEDECGVLLLHRTTRAVTLSDAGRVFLQRARCILDDYQEARDQARGGRGDPRGTLRLTASVLFGAHYVTPVIAEFVERYPHVNVDVVLVDRVVNLVEEGFDLALRIGPLPDSLLTATRVGEVRRVVCGSREYLRRKGTPASVAELAHHDIIAARPVSPTNHWRFADGHAVKVRPRLSFSTVSGAITAAACSAGLTRVLSYQINPEISVSPLQTVLSEYEPEPLPVHLVHTEGGEASAKVRAFLELARPRLRERL